jgi:hypothetical protein
MDRDNLRNRRVNGRGTSPAMTKRRLSPPAAPAPRRRPLAARRQNARIMACRARSRQSRSCRRMNRRRSGRPSPGKPLLGPRRALLRSQLPYRPRPSASRAVHRKGANDIGHCVMGRRRRHIALPCMRQRTATIPEVQFDRRRGWACQSRTRRTSGSDAIRPFLSWGTTAPPSRRFANEREM